MPALNLSDDDREYFAGASMKAREWMERDSRAFSVGEAEREIEAICGPADPLERRTGNERLSASGALYEYPIEQAIGNFQAFNRSAADAERALAMSFARRPYRAVSRPWADDIWEQEFYDRERPVDAGPFITFAYPWVHGRLNTNSGLLEVGWVNRQWDASTGILNIEFQDASEFYFGTYNDSSCNGVYIGGPMDGQRITPRDYEWIMSDLGNGRTGNRFHFRAPTPINLNRRVRDEDLLTMPCTMEQVTYTGTIFMMPDYRPNQLNNNMFKFLVLRQIP